MMKLLKRIEQYQVEKENEFRAGREGREDLRERGGMADTGDVEREGENSFEFIVSHDTPAKTAVHMPGYPEYVMVVHKNNFCKHVCNS